jgi:hypothetical protein
VGHLLHLVKDSTNTLALDVIRAQATDPEARLSVVLLPGAGALTEPLPAAVYRLSGGHADLPPAPGVRTIGPQELLDLVFAADSVVTW